MVERLWEIGHRRERYLAETRMRLIWRREYSELLQTGMVAGAVVLVLSIGMPHPDDLIAIVLTMVLTILRVSCQHIRCVNRRFFPRHDMAAYGTGTDHVRFRPHVQRSEKLIPLPINRCVLLWNHVAHIVAINAKPPPEDELRSSSSRSSSSKSSSSSSSSRSASSSSRDPSRSSSSSSGLRPSSSSTSSSSSRPASSSSSSSRPSSSSSSSSAARLASSSSRSSSPSGSGSSSNRSSSSRDKELAKDEKDEDPDPWGKAHPSSKVSRPQPRLWPFPIGLANPASRDNDGKERVWWEGGEPHQVGYIGGIEGSSDGAAAPDESALAGASSSSRDMSASSARSSSAASLDLKPTPEELDDIKAIMKGKKELSKDKDKRARQKELVKLMSGKKSSDDAAPPSQNLDLSASTSSVEPPSTEELAEVKAIMKGKAELSTEKDKRARQKELMKMLMAKKSSGDRASAGSSSQSTSSASRNAPEVVIAPPTTDELTELQDILRGKAELSTDKTKRDRQKELIKMVTGGGGKDDPPVKKGVSFADEPLGPTGSGDPGKSSSSRFASGGSKPASGSHSSSSLDPTDGANGTPTAGPSRSGSSGADGLSQQDE